MKKEEYELRKMGILNTEEEIYTLAKSNADHFFEKNCIKSMQNFIKSSAPCVYVSSEDSFHLLHRSFPDVQIQ